MFSYRLLSQSASSFLMFSILWTSGSNAADVSTMRPYNVKEGQITYQLSGSQAGTETLSFTDYGRRTRRESHTSLQMMGMTQQQDSILLTDGLWIYQYDSDKQEATKRKNPMFASLAEEDLARLRDGEGMMKTLGGVMTGKDTVLGHTCNIWELKQLMTSTCVTSDWLALWTKSGMGDLGIQQIATAITIGPVSAEITSLPVGTKIVDAIDPMEQLRQFRQQASGQSSTKKKKRGAPLTPEEMREAEKMREEFQGKGLNRMMESFREMQEPFKQRGGALGQ